MIWILMEKYFYNSRGIRERTTKPPPLPSELSGTLFFYYNFFSGLKLPETSTDPKNWHLKIFKNSNQICTWYIIKTVLINQLTIKKFVDSFIILWQTVDFLNGREIAISFKKLIFCHRRPPKYIIDFFRIRKFTFFRSTSLIYNELSPQKQVSIRTNCGIVPI